MNKILIEKVKDIFEKGYAPGHGFDHAQRVSVFAKRIAKAEGYDQDEAQVSGLLHDVGRTLIDEQKGHGPAGVALAQGLLDNYTNFDMQAKKRILNAIEHHSDKYTQDKLSNILQDADKIDGMGAVGVFRVATTNGDIPQYDKKSFSLTVESASHSPKTLYEYTLYITRWMSMLYTDKAKEIAKKRYEFLLEFLNEYKREIEESK